MSLRKLNQNKGKMGYFREQDKGRASLSFGASLWAETGYPFCSLITRCCGLNFGSTHNSCAKTIRVIYALNYAKILHIKKRKCAISFVTAQRTYDNRKSMRLTILIPFAFVT